jgi:uncharacterized protein YegL
MESLASDTIGGYNSFIEEQKKVPGEANLTTVLFDDKYELVHDRVNLRDVKPITNKEYFARGCTALLDAIGKTINSIGEKLNNMEESERPSKVIVLIVTDGEENASREFNYWKIKEMVERQKNVYNWQFLFFGANIDSFTAGQSIGISLDYAVNFSATSDGLDSTYNAINDAVASYRGSGQIDANYKKDVV